MSRSNSPHLAFAQAAHLNNTRRHPAQQTTQEDRDKEADIFRCPTMAPLLVNDGDAPFGIAYALPHLDADAEALVDIFFALWDGENHREGLASMLANHLDQARQQEARRPATPFQSCMYSPYRDEAWLKIPAKFLETSGGNDDFLGHHIFREELPFAVRRLRQPLFGGALGVACDAQVVGNQSPQTLGRPRPALRWFHEAWEQHADNFERATARELLCYWARRLRLVLSDSHARHDQHPLTSQCIHFLARYHGDHPPAMRLWRTYMDLGGDTGAQNDQRVLQEVLRQSLIAHEGHPATTERGMLEMAREAACVLTLLSEALRNEQPRRVINTGSLVLLQHGGDTPPRAPAPPRVPTPLHGPSPSHSAPPRSRETSGGLEGGWVQAFASAAGDFVAQVAASPADAPLDDLIAQAAASPTGDRLGDLMAQAVASGYTVVSSAADRATTSPPIGSSLRR